MLFRLFVYTAFFLTPFWVRFTFEQWLPIPAWHVVRFLLFYCVLGAVICGLLLCGWQRRAFTPHPPAPSPTGEGEKRTITYRLDKGTLLWALILLVWVLWAWASQFWAFARALEPNAGASAAVQTMVAALFGVVVAWGASARLITVRGVTLTLMVALLLHTVVTLLQSLQGNALGLIGLNELPFGLSADWTSILHAGDLLFVRPYGLTPHPNILAGTLVIGLLAAGGALFGGGRWLRWAAALLIPPAALALLLTFSRAAWLGAVAGGVAFVAILWRMRKLPLPQPSRRFAYSGRGSRLFHFRKSFHPETASPLPQWGRVGEGEANSRSRRRVGEGEIVIAILLTCIVGIGFAVQFSPFLAARAGVGAAEDVEMRSLSDRRVYADIALNIIREQPLQGVGVGSFAWVAADRLADTDFDLRGDHVHNIYLLLIAEQGVIGFGLWLTALLLGVWNSLRAYRHDPKPERAALLCAGVALLVIGLFDHYPATLFTMQVWGWGVLGVTGNR